MKNLVVLALLLPLCLGGIWSSETVVKNPKHDVLDPETQWVANPDSILTTKEVERLNGMLTKLHNEGKLLHGCKTGVEFAVVVINTMGTWDTSENAASKFTRNLHDSWGVGDETCNNGVLFLLSRKDRVLWISVGQGTKYIITDKKIQSLKRGAVPLLKNGKTGEAVLYITEELVSMLKTGEAVDPTFFERIRDFFEDHIGYLIALFIFAFIIIGGINEYKQTSQLSRLQKLQKTLDEAKPDKPIEANLCPICLDDFKTPFDKWTEQTLKDEKLRVLRCGHAFHDACVLDWLKTNTSCPICRKSVLPPGQDDKDKSERREPRDANDTDQSNNNNSDTLPSTETGTYQHSPVFVRPIQDRLWIDYILIKARQRSSAIQLQRAKAAKSSSGSRFGGGRSSSGGGGFRW